MQQTSQETTGLSLKCQKVLQVYHVNSARWKIIFDFEISVKSFKTCIKLEFLSPCIFSLNWKPLSCLNWIKNALIYHFVIADTTRFIHLHLVNIIFHACGERKKKRRHISMYETLLCCNKKHFLFNLCLCMKGKKISNYLYPFRSPFAFMEYCISYQFRCEHVNKTREHFFSLLRTQANVKWIGGTALIKVKKKWKATSSNIPFFFF